MAQTITNSTLLHLFNQLIIHLPFGMQRQVVISVLETAHQFLQLPFTLCKAPMPDVSLGSKIVPRTLLRIMWLEVSTGK
jgi:hypothetical protein